MSGVKTECDGEVEIVDRNEELAKLVEKTAKWSRYRIKTIIRTKNGCWKIKWVDSDDDLHDNDTDPS